MGDVAAALLARLSIGGDPGEFERRYVAEWSAGVVFPPGLPALLRDLRRDHRLAVVSDTHSSTMVPQLLATAGIAGLFDAVVLSVEVGWHKPDPRMYTTALEALRTTPAEAIFVGDSYLADYAGPSAVGISAFLIDPAKSHHIPDDRRIDSVFDLRPGGGGAASARL
jgi:putative hydrolase of the HAD superfamily